MRGLFVTLLLLGWPFWALAVDAPAGRVIKVLPLFLDQKGRDALSPSLFDRDAYQVYLRQHTNEISALRIDVLWKAANTRGARLNLRVELRGAGPGGLPQQVTLEKTVTPGSFRRWTSLTLVDQDYQKFGGLAAWRVTLWLGDRLMGEQKSFLW
ncbi:MAG TPA: hypothetical protein VMB80_09680 [Candidatus Acidoferrum sp.]|nr:hypothetical protein [Candidatus Acidoferrum sp.]